MIRSTVFAVGRALRAFWLAVGIAVALVLAVELAYRAQGGVRSLIRDVRAPKQLANPAVDLLAESYSTAELTEWHPYIYFRRKPFSGRYTTIDSLGLRHTVQAPLDGSHRDLFMFGASPLWGTGLRDSMTIPSRLSSVLAARGVRDVQITNFGEGGEVLTQEVIDLMLQLRAGKRPAVVVFYDGYNDLAAAMANGRAGFTKSEADRARWFDAGKTLFDWRHDARSELHVAERLAQIASTRFLVLQRAFGGPASTEAPLHISDDSLADDIVHTYMGTVEIVQALERQYGFSAYYAWMPMLDPRQKRMSPFERQLNATAMSDPWTLHFLALHRMSVERVEPEMQRVAPRRFVELSGLFANDSQTVYVEQGHTTEAASNVIAEHLADDLVPMLAKNGVASPRAAKNAGAPGSASYER